MDGFGRAIGRGFDGLSDTVGDITSAFGGSLGEMGHAIDEAFHQLLPEAIPSWIVLVVMGIIGIFILLRR